MTTRNRSKIKFELSRSLAALVALAGVVALLWMFVFGVFVGRRYSPDTYLVRSPLQRPEQPAAKVKESPPAERFAQDLARQKEEALVEEPQASPEPEEKPAPPAEVKKEQGAAYAVQVGAFNEEERAQAMIAELGKAGWRAYLYKGRSSPRFRVRLGPYAKRQEAERAASAVGQKLGLKPYLLEPAEGRQGEA